MPKSHAAAEVSRLYDDRFYDRIRKGCQDSAAAAVPVILPNLPEVESVVDVGAGEGWWGWTFRQWTSCRLTCIDHARPPSSPVAIGGSTKGEQFLELDLRFAQHPDLHTLRDLDGHLAENGRYSLAVCLEVAEHLEPERAESFVSDLCDLADVVLFSAAMPGQGGDGHINNQPPLYWADRFHDHSYDVTGALRWPLWDLEDVKPWYKSNLLLAAKGGTNWVDGLFHGRAAGPLHVVHPDLWLDRERRR